MQMKKKEHNNNYWMIVKPKLAVPNVQDLNVDYSSAKESIHHLRDSCRLASHRKFDIEWWRCAKQYKSVMKTILVRHFPTKTHFMWVNESVKITHKHCYQCKLIRHCLPRKEIYSVYFFFSVKVKICNAQKWIFLFIFLLFCFQTSIWCTSYDWYYKFCVNLKKNKNNTHIICAS